MLGYIYNEKYFFKNILSTEKKDVKNTLLIKDSFYTNREIIKKDGIRILSCIEKYSSIYILQNNLRLNFLNHIPIPENVKGFVSGHSYKDFLLAHTSQKYFLRLDIKNFFDNITSKLIKEIFGEYFKLEDSSTNKEILEMLTEIVTLNNVLPQGGVSSPTVSNIIFRRLDIRISRYCKKFNIRYTRYADDLLFSSDKGDIHKSFFIKKIAYILNGYNFKINSSKINKAKDYISLNGFVIRDDVYLSRKRKSDISKVLFLIETNKDVDYFNNLLVILNNNSYQYKSYVFEDKSMLINYLAGYRSFIIGWLPKNKSNTNYSKYENLIERIEKNIDILLEKK